MIIPLFNTLNDILKTYPNIRVTIGQTAASKIIIKIQNTELNNIIYIGAKSQNNENKFYISTNINNLESNIIFSINNRNTRLINTIKRNLGLENNSVSLQSNRNLERLTPSRVNQQVPNSRSYAVSSNYKPIETHTIAYWSEYYRLLRTTPRETLRHHPNIKSQINSSLDYGNKMTNNEFKNTNEYKKFSSSSFFDPFN
jgi:hypothetical protein